MHTQMNIRRVCKALPDIPAALGAVSLTQGLNSDRDTRERVCVAV